MLQAEGTTNVKSQSQDGVQSSSNERTTYAWLVSEGRGRHEPEAAPEPGWLVRSGTCSQHRWGQGWGDGQ